MSPRARKPPPTADEARTAIKAIYDDAPVKRLRNANEADTRAKVIDRVLDAVGWSHTDVRRETASGSGDFLDYELWTTSEPWLVVEAKREGRTFDLSSAGRRRADSRLRKLGTLISRGGNQLREVLKQAATYCNDRGIPLACVTNRYQWLFFRGLSGQSRPWNHGSALVFDGPADILAHFDDFVGALGRASAGSSHLPELLERPRRDIPAPKVPRDYLRMARATVEPEDAAVARAIGDALFADLYQYDRRDMLRGCYVTPGIAGDFERSIQRLLKDSERSVDTGNEDVARASTNAFISEIERHDRLSAIEYPVLVVGHVGAGKTTFLHKSLSALRGDAENDEEPKAICAIVDLEGHGQGGIVNAADEESRVAREILEKLGTAATTVLKKHRGISEGDLNHADPFSPETLRTLQQRRSVGQDAVRFWTSSWILREQLNVLSEHVVLWVRPGADWPLEFQSLDEFWSSSEDPANINDWVAAFVADVSRADESDAPLFRVPLSAVSGNAWTVSSDSDRHSRCLRLRWPEDARHRDAIERALLGPAYVRR